METKAYSCRVVEMAQDKLGHAYTFYKLLSELGDSEPDTIAFTRNAPQFHNCQFVELPIGDYSFSLIRHFLFDHSEMIRFKALSDSSIEEISQIARKLTGEIKYHVLHADAFIKKLGSATTESIQRLQESLDRALPYALGIFETSKYEPELIEMGLYPGEDALKGIWLNQIKEVMSTTELILPPVETHTPVIGGRYGNHTEHLQPLLDEMSEVISSDPTADW